MRFYRQICVRIVIFFALPVCLHAATKQLVRRALVEFQCAAGDKFRLDCKPCICNPATLNELLCDQQVCRRKPRCEYDVCTRKLCALCYCLKSGKELCKIVECLMSHRRQNHRHKLRRRAFQRPQNGFCDPK